MDFPQSIRSLQILSCLQYANNLMAIYAAYNSKLTLQVRNLARVSQWIIKSKPGFLKSNKIPLTGFQSYLDNGLFKNIAICHISIQQSISICCIISAAMLHKSLIHSRFSNYFIKLQAFKDLNISGRSKHKIYYIYYEKHVLLNAKKQRNKRKH